MENRKVVIVTGGGKAVLKDGGIGAIGYGIATAFAKEGYNVVVTGRNKQKLDDAKEEIESLYGVKVLGIQADVSNDGKGEEYVKNVIDETIKEFGKINALVNNAQASASGIKLFDHTMEQFDLAMYSGLYSTFLYMKHAYPYLKETQGSVINFGSGAGLFGNFGQGSYAAAKEGIRGMSRVAAVEWGADNINVNIVCPLSYTAALEKWKEYQPEAYEKNIKGIPMGRFGDPEHDIGRVCVQLASDDFKYMSGETITLQGGSGQRP